MARPSAEEMFKNMIGRRDTAAAQPVQEARRTGRREKKGIHRAGDGASASGAAQTAQGRRLPPRLRYVELVRQALDQFFA